MPKTAEKSQCGRSICPGPFFLKIRHFKDISQQLCLVHFMTLCSYEHRCSKMTTFVVCVAEALDSLLIKTHPGRVLMLFLTSCTPVPVVLSKTIIQNVFRSCLTFKFGLHQVFLLFAFPQVIKQTLLCDSSYVQFLSGKQDWLPPWFPCPSCFSLKEIKEPQMYCVCLKYDGPVINTKITHTQSREAIFF